MPPCTDYVPSKNETDARKVEYRIVIKHWQYYSRYYNSTIIASVKSLVEDMVSFIMLYTGAVSFPTNHRMKAHNYLKTENENCIL